MMDSLCDRFVVLQIRFESGIVSKVCTKRTLLAYEEFFFQVTDQSVNQFTVLRVYQDKMTDFVQIVGCYLFSSFQILTVSKKKCPLYKKIIVFSTVINKQGLKSLLDVE